MWGKPAGQDGRAFASGRIAPIVVAALAVAAALDSAAQAQGPARRTVMVGGARIEIQSPPGPLSDEELARTLERAAQSLRERKEAPAVGSAPAVSLPTATGIAPGAANSVPSTLAEMAAQTPLPAERTTTGEPAPLEGSRWQLLPGSVLFAPPIANPTEPRFFGKPTTLESAHTSSNIDTAIGGVLPLLRHCNSDDPRDAFQIDAFAVVFSRWRSANESVGVDYRAGVPFTWARGPWEFKLAYEHTSTHLGDEFAERTGRRYASHVREELVLGVGYRFCDDFRVYGQYGYAFNLRTIGVDNPSRLDIGLEWSRPIAEGYGLRGRPYAALDLEFRGVNDLSPSFTGQAGWQWRSVDFGPSLRVGLEYFNGFSPYGQFFQDREDWFGFGIFFGF